MCVEYVWNNLIALLVSPPTLKTREKFKIYTLCSYIWWYNVTDYDMIEWHSYQNQNKERKKKIFVTILWWHMHIKFECKFLFSRAVHLLINTYKYRISSFCKYNIFSLWTNTLRICLNKIVSTCTCMHIQIFFVLHWPTEYCVYTSILSSSVSKVIRFEFVAKLRTLRHLRMGQVFKIGYGVYSPCSVYSACSLCILRTLRMVYGLVPYCPHELTLAYGEL